jgi:hypothetical protein
MFQTQYCSATRSGSIRRVPRAFSAGFLPSGDPGPAAVARSYAGRVASVGKGVMGSPQDHRKCAEECVAMARLSQADSDKALWLTLAQSWVRLAEHVARADAQPAPHSGETVS